MTPPDVFKLIGSLIEAFDAGEKTADEVIEEMREMGAIPDSGSDEAAAALAADARPPNASSR